MLITNPPSITVFTALRAWLMSLVGINGDNVFRGLDNRVPMPKGDFILMREIAQKRIATTVNYYQETRAAFTGAISGNVLITSSVVGEIALGATIFGTGIPTNTLIVSGSDNSWLIHPAITTPILSEPMSSALALEEFQQSLDFVIQLDCYGSKSTDQSALISTLFRSSQAVEFFNAYKIVPLYNEDASQAPLVNGEEQYEKRWLIRLHLQYDPAIVSSMQFFSSATINLVREA